MTDETPKTETPRQVLAAAVDMVTTWDPPTARDVLGIFIRMECARAGIAMPRLDGFDKDEIKAAILR